MLIVPSRIKDHFVPNDSQDKIEMLLYQADESNQMFEQTGNMVHLIKAIKSMGVAIQEKGTSADHTLLQGYAELLSAKFSRTGSIEDATLLIDIGRQAVDITPSDHPHRSAVLSNLGMALYQRFKRTDAIKDLDNAINAAGEAIDAFPANEDDNTTRAKILCNLGAWLAERFHRNRSVCDFNKAVAAFEEAISITPHNHSDRAGYLSNLGGLLGESFEEIDLPDRLSQSIEYATEALKIEKTDDHDRAIHLSNLGLLISRRSARNGSVEDLNQAISYSREALQIMSDQQHPDRISVSSTLSEQLGERFERTGSVNDLNQAINIASEIVDLTPHGHASRPACLSRFGGLLESRFDLIGSLQDINQAVKAADDAVSCYSADDPARMSTLNSLGNKLGKRSARTGAISDLNRAIEVLSEAAASMPQGHARRARYENNLGNWLSARFHMTGSLHDLNRSIESATAAMTTAPAAHPERAGYIQNLATKLYERYEKTGSKDDLDRAIEFTHDAVRDTPGDHPHCSKYLSNLAHYYRQRFDKYGSTEDWESQLSSYIACWEHKNGPLMVRIRAARYAAYALASEGDWDRSSQLLDDAVSLLPKLSPRSLDHTDSQDQLSSFLGLASAAAAAALNADKSPQHALKLLELGRGVIAGLLMDMRGDIKDLRDQYPDLAERYAFLRDSLDFPQNNSSLSKEATTMSAWESQVEQRREADMELDRVICLIRSKPNFSGFLQSPSEEEMMSAAAQGPIIMVNASEFRCDAFIIGHQSLIQVVELRDLTLDDIHQRAGDFRGSSINLLSGLDWLWRSICQPCLDALGFTEPPSHEADLPHIWWVPTGLVSHFPLHAAGNYYKRASAETVLDRAISSYASSIKALLYSRRLQPARSPSPQMLNENSALTVAMATTPGLVNGSLHFATDEVEVVEEFCSSAHLTLAQPPRRKKDVLDEMKRCKVFHFAGHGQLDPNEPSRSRLLLDDWETDPLSVGDLRDSRLQDSPPFLAYLSACSTGANMATNLSDESIHLASAFQLGGFRHVIGTLWEVSDRHCVDVARILYKTLGEEGLTDAAVARGLHRAVKTLRDEAVRKNEAGPRDATLVKSGGLRKVGSSMSFSWAPYVHFGA